MRHVILTCKNHPDLRWSTKEAAVTNGRYNGARHLFFTGHIATFKGMHQDGSGIDVSPVQKNADGTFTVHRECDCSSYDLVVAPEDALVKRS